MTMNTADEYGDTAKGRAITNSTATGRPTVIGQLNARYNTIISF